MKMWEAEGISDVEPCRPRSGWSVREKDEMKVQVDGLTRFRVSRASTGEDPNTVQKVVIESSRGRNADLQDGNETAAVVVERWWKGVKCQTTIDKAAANPNEQWKDTYQPEFVSLATFIVEIPDMPSGGHSSASHPSRIEAQGPHWFPRWSHYGHPGWHYDTTEDCYDFEYHLCEQFSV